MDSARKEKIKQGKIPEHVAIIMDGNRRWAKEHNLLAMNGHEKGKETLRSLAEFQQNNSDVPIKVITLYSLSEDNKQKRTEQEFNALMNLFEKGFKELVDDESLMENKTKISVFGNYKTLPEKVSKMIDEAIEKTKDNDQFFLNFCINYDGQTEIVEACKKISEKIANNELISKDINKELIKKNIFTSNFKAPDLIIRSGGEKRLSAFLLWDSSYSEFYFSDKYWPDIDGDDIMEAIEEYQNRNRRFGG